MKYLKGHSVSQEVSNNRNFYLALKSQIECQIQEAKIQSRYGRDVALDSRIEAAKAEGAIEALDLVLVLLTDNLAGVGK